MKLKTTYYQCILSEFDTHIISTKSVKTGNHYSGQVHNFLQFLEDNNIFHLNQVNKKVMEHYFHHLTTRPKLRGEGNLTTRTINDNLSTLRMLSKNMLKKQLITHEIPVPNNISMEDQYDQEENPHQLFALTRQIVSTEELKEIFYHCNSNIEKSLIALAYGSALRRSSLEALEDSQIDYQNGMVTVIRAKNNKTREVPISQFFLQHLRNYSTERMKILAQYNSRNRSFFIDEIGQSLSGDKLNKLLKTIISRTQNIELISKNITLHCLRHSSATHLMDNGCSFEFVKNYLGHSEIDTSTIYAKRRKIKNIYAI